MTTAELLYLVVRGGGAGAVVTAIEALNGKVAGLEAKLARAEVDKEDVLTVLTESREETERLLAERTAERDELKEALVDMLNQRAEWEKQRRTEHPSEVFGALSDLLEAVERLLEGRELKTLKAGLGYNVTAGEWLELRERALAARRVVPLGTAAACEGVDGAGSETPH